MRRFYTALLAASSVAGCASDRIIDQSHSFSADLSELAQQEIVDNLDETVDNPYRIPRRTTFGKGALTFSDAGGASLALPLHLFGKNPGTATGTIGTITDSYQLSIVPEVGGPTLLALRQVYQAAVFPENYKPVAIPLTKYLGTPLRWLYWKRRDGSPSGNEPPAGSTRIRMGAHYEFWTTWPEAFATFALLTYGASPQEDRVGTASLLPTSKPGARGARGPQSGNGGPRSNPRASGIPFIATPLKPQSNFGLILKELSVPKAPPSDNSSVVPPNAR